MLELLPPLLPPPRGPPGKRPTPPDEEVEDEELPVMRAPPLDDEAAAALADEEDAVDGPGPRPLGPGSGRLPKLVGVEDATAGPGEAAWPRPRLSLPLPLESGPR